MSEEMIVTVRPDYQTERGVLRPWFARPLYRTPRVGSGGQGAPLKLTGDAVRLVRHLNRYQPALMQWLVKDNKDGIYLTKTGAKWDETDVYYWPMIAIGFNSLRVEAQQVRGVGGWFYRVIGLSSFDHWLARDTVYPDATVHRIYTNNNFIVRDTPSGFVGLMPLLEPSVLGLSGGLYINSDDVIDEIPTPPIPLPPDWWNAPTAPLHGMWVQALDQVVLRDNPSSRAGRVGVIGAFTTFEVSGTERDHRGHIWGQVWGTKRWALLYDARRKRYLTTWRP